MENETMMSGLEQIAKRYELDVVARCLLYTHPWRVFYARLAYDESWGTMEAFLVAHGIATQWDIDLAKA